MATIPDFRALTAIRGVAAWWVVLFHFKEYLPQGVPRPIAASGYLAVDLFFELSGFIIALNYAHRFQTINVREIIAFLSIRLARIYPLHLFMLILFLANPLVILLFRDKSGPEYDPQYFALSLVLLQNWGFTSKVAWNVPAWSISSEWFVYLLFPFMAWCSGRWVRNRLRAAGAGLALLFVLAIFFASTSGNLGEGVPYTGLTRCVLEFSAGIGIYLFWTYRPVSQTG